MDVICFEKIYDVPIAPDGYRLAARSVANDQSVLFLFVELAGKDDVAETFKQGIGIFPRPKMRTQRRFCLLKITAGSWDKIELPELDATFPLVDMFPNGKILVVGPRCVWRSKRDYDLKRIVDDPRTGHSSRILLGDGINRRANRRPGAYSGCHMPTRASTAILVGKLRATTCRRRRARVLLRIGPEAVGVSGRRRKHDYRLLRLKRIRFRRGYLLLHRFSDLPDIERFRASILEDKSARCREFGDL